MGAILVNKKCVELGIPLKNPDVGLTRQSSSTSSEEEIEVSSSSPEDEDAEATSSEAEEMTEVSSSEKSPMRSKVGRKKRKKKKVDSPFPSPTEEMETANNKFDEETTDEENSPSLSKKPKKLVLQISSESPESENVSENSQRDQILLQKSKQNENSKIIILEPVKARPRVQKKKLKIPKKSTIPKKTPTTMKVKKLTTPRMNNNINVDSFSQNSNEKKKWKNQQYPYKSPRQQIQQSNYKGNNRISPHRHKSPRNRMNKFQIHQGGKN